jgi:hypothetical protein
MSDLQLALIALAAILLIGLYLAGKWQERRLLRRLSEGLRGNIGDALLNTAPAASSDTAPSAGPGRVEPRFPGRAPPDARTDAPTVPDMDDSGIPPKPPLDIDLDDAEGGQRTAAAEPARPPATVHSSDWVEDPLLDCVLELRCTRAVDGVAVIDAATRLVSTDRTLPVFFVVWDARIKDWVLPDRFGYYSDALAAIQMANRRQVLTEIEASRFVASVQQVAAALDADFDPPDIARLVASAQELDRLCARFDVRIGLTLESTTGAWSAQRLDLAAQQAGLEAVDPQRWVKLDADRLPLFSLASASLLTDRLALELDVPLAPVSGAPLRAMTSTANVLAAALGARVVDDNGRPISANSVAAIEAQLARLVGDMRAAGIEPGSPRARRLYV